MINITATSSSIRIDGHAGYAPKGQDIVCASVSILAYSVAETLRQMGENCDMGNGFCHIQVPQGREDILTVVLNGFRLLAENYPDYVAFTFREEDGNKESSTLTDRKGIL